MESLQSKVFKALNRVVDAESMKDFKAEHNEFDYKMFQIGCEIKMEMIGNTRCYVFYPKVYKQEKTLIYTHGGGYVGPIDQNHFRFCARIARQRGIKVYMVDYSLAPYAQYPVAMDEVFEVYNYLLKIDFSSNIYILGDSAGGGLAFGSVLRMKDENLPLPGKLILLCPWLDITMSNPHVSDVQKEDHFLHLDYLEKCAADYAGDHDHKHPYISPKFGKIDKDLPPIVLHIGTDDVLYPDCFNFRIEAEEKGVDLTYRVWKDMVHNFMLLPFVPEAKKALEEILEEI